MQSLLPRLVMQLASPWTRGLIGAAIMSMIIWSFLPLIPSLGGPIARAVAIIAVVIVFIAVTALIQHRRKRRERALEAAVTTGGNQAEEANSAHAEIAALRSRLKDAIATLRKRGVRRLYELPWYMVIGPPGAGKTTALQQSGLHFPLADTGVDTLPGIGGTRLCDWWFAEEAVLIDTAGRYTTQDTNHAIDKASWLGFLDLLRRARPRQPITGLIVVVSLLELVEATPELREAHARAIRLRINEVTERLKLRLPVYMIFSKLDRLAGFDVFFDDLDSTGRDQVLGMTFPLDQGQEAFTAEFRLLIERQEARLIERLQGEHAQDRRAVSVGFPLQMASLEHMLDAFLSSAFKGSRLDPPPFLRGVYFTSATQSGTPLDRLAGMLARSFGIDQKPAPDLRLSAGRGYFISGMMREVILGETPLASTSPSRFRRRKTLRLSALTAVGCMTIAGLAFIWSGDLQARLAIQQKQDLFEDYRHAVASIPPGPIDSDDALEKVNTVLTQAATLPMVRPQNAAELWGLSSRQKLADIGQTAYLDALQHLLYPRLVWRLEQQIRSHLQDPAYLYDATRVYLMLGGAGPRDPDVIANWIESDWEDRFPGALNEGLRRDLAGHLSRLLAAPLPSRELQLDGDLVSEARTAFSYVTPAERIYNRLRASLVEPAAADWSPEQALGPTIAIHFARRSGRPLSDSIPAFLTGSAFSTMMHRDLPPAARRVADESWVTGSVTNIAIDGSQVASLERDVAQLWANEARHVWDTLFADLALRPFGDQHQTETNLYLLSSPQSPMRDLLISIARALRIEPPPSGDPTAPVAADWNAHYAALSSLVGQTGQSSQGGSPSQSSSVPIDGIMRLIGQLDDELAAGGTAPAGLPQIAAQSLDPAQRLLAEASRQPPPVAGWLQQIAHSGNATLGHEARTAASDAYNTPSGPGAVCSSLVKDYPFDTTSAMQAPLADFARLFAPGGLLDGYFQVNVAPYVDTSGPVWRLHAAGGVAPPFTIAKLEPFQRAARIRQAFFPTAAPPVLYLTITLSGTADASLSLGSVTVSPGQPASVVWPGADSLSPAVLKRSVSTPARAATPKPARVLAEERGPWALFQLVGSATALQPHGSSRAYLVSNNTGFETITVDSGAGHEPFDASQLSGFVCPQVP